MSLPGGIPFHSSVLNKEMDVNQMKTWSGKQT